MGTSLAVALGGQFSSIVSPGAGRYRDLSFPEPAWLAATLAQTVSGVRPGSNGATGFPLFAKTVYTADPGTPTGPVASLGINVMAILSGAAAGQGYCCICLQPRLVPTPITVDEIAFTRIIWIMACGNPPANATTDIGGYVVIPNSATPDMRVMGGISGFGFQFSSMTTPQFVAQGPNGRILTPTAINDINYHAYELRIIPSTRTQYAQLQAFIDDVPFPLPALSSSWAPGTNLPSPSITANKVGFGVGVINNCLASCNLLINQVRIIQAPTLQDCF